MIEITGSTRIYGIVADPVAQVKTPQTMHKVFERRGTDGRLHGPFAPAGGFPQAGEEADAQGEGWGGHQGSIGRGGERRGLISLREPSWAPWFRASSMARVRSAMGRGDTGSV